MLLLINHQQQRNLINQQPFSHFIFRNEKCETFEDANLETLFQKVDQSENFTWVDIEGLDDKKKISELCSHFGLNPLIIEDIYHPIQRPKIAQYENCLYLVVLDCFEGKSLRNVEMKQINIILFEKKLFVFHNEEISHFSEIEKTIIQNPSFLSGNIVDHLCISLVSLIIDNYFDLVDRKNEIIDKLEHTLIKNPQRISLESIYKIKRQIYLHLKVIQPLGRIFFRLLSEGSPFVSTEMEPYLRDLYEHTERLIERLDTQREVITGILEIHLSSMGNKINQTMKVLTLFATIFIPLGFFASVFGMNFKYMPLINWVYGYVVFWCISILIILFFIWYFRKKNLF